MKSKVFIRVFEAEKSSVQNIARLSTEALVGYYLSMYPGDPISALLVDMQNNIVPITAGTRVKKILEVIIKEK